MSRKKCKDSTSIGEDSSELLRFSVSLSKKLLSHLDSTLTTRGYASRSELIRDMIREKLVEEQWESGEEVLNAVLVIVYDHHVKELNQRMIDIQHHVQNLKILCTTHVHLDHHNCLETIVLSGRTEDIHQIALEIGGLRGVKSAKLNKIVPFEADS